MALFSVLPFADERVNVCFNKRFVPR